MAGTMAAGVAIAVVAGALWLTSAGMTEGTRKLGVADPTALTTFERVATVLESPRCMNCHPRSDRPHTRR